MSPSPFGALRFPLQLILNNIEEKIRNRIEIRSYMREKEKRSHESNSLLPEKLLTTTRLNVNKKCL